MSGSKRGRGREYKYEKIRSILVRKIETCSRDECLFGKVHTHTNIMDGYYFIVITTGAITASHQNVMV